MIALPAASADCQGKYKLKDSDRESNARLVTHFPGSLF